MMKNYQSILLFSLLFIFLTACESDYKLDLVNKDLKRNSTEKMVLVEAGPAIIGDDAWFEKGHKKRTITLKGYYIDQYEVSNQDYNTCYKAGECRKPEYPGMKEINNPLQPVVGVSFDDAKAFCQWMGKRLPTEEEWEKAARGPQGNTYPWGNKAIDCQKANYGHVWSKDCMKDGNYAFSKPITAYPESKSYYGAYNMVGNVWEWVDQDYEPAYFNKPKASKASHKTIKGGSYGSAAKYLVAYSRRWERPYQRTVATGFRCVKDLK